ncbi:multicopper oxidase family protein [Nannocystis punicea]|uniref:Multicopper oxidase domain-containing protein n=1 Tax=Nannocystis punicea TaxID=2995304 RepID=A0ABY7H971_9BACT|nr:multicopper oxidase domain-containing protein [Nannocystis poenicansa]WAS95816.1 multicopper oxidase domain-containing protein [Nannocystis poenicansa]
MHRRKFIQGLGMAAGGAAGLRLTPALAEKGGKGPKGSGTGGEPMPISPLILAPFNEPLPIPQPLAPSNPATWTTLPGAPPPGPGVGQQSSRKGTHQIWTNAANLPGFPLVDPIIYQIKLQVGSHSFTSSPVKDARDGTIKPSLPASTIYGFNGVFPGPMIRAFYGRPALVRFENHLDKNPLNLPRGDFGDPELKFLTHLHNGHTAPESDGNPHHSPLAYEPGMFVDNLYLNWPPDNDPREKQAFFWYHDHVMDHTSENVYKGMVGIYPIYDPGFDGGDETVGLRLPSFAFDIPLVFADFALDDGVTPHAGHGQDGLAHPENWGKTFFAHYVRDGFVGDIFTVNGKAFPFLAVKRRKYRFRFLDASVSRWYEFMLMQGTPKLKSGVQGQYLLGGAEQVMRFTLIASDGGLLPAPLVQDSIAIAPAKRREVIVDFTRYQDGSPTGDGDEIYLTNILTMRDGRKPDGLRNENVPVLKFVIDGDELAPDLSQIPPVLRELPKIPANLDGLVHRTFELQRKGGLWTINGELFDHHVPLALPKKGSGEVWTLKNGGGGWMHPMHIHQEEHRTLSRDGKPVLPGSPDFSKEDTTALDSGEEVVIFRRFRTFTGKYVAHCHNLIHEDHAMMFSWDIVP